MPCGYSRIVYTAIINMVSEAGLEKFNQLYKQEFGIELSREELIEKANRLLNLYKVVYLPESKISMRQDYEKKTQPEKNSK